MDPAYVANHTKNHEHPVQIFKHKLSSRLIKTKMTSTIYMFIWENYNKNLRKVYYKSVELDLYNNTKLDKMELGCEIYDHLNLERSNIKNWWRLFINFKPKFKDYVGRAENIRRCCRAFNSLSYNGWITQIRLQNQKL